MLITNSCEVFGTLATSKIQQVSCIIWFKPQDASVARTNTLNISGTVKNFVVFTVIHTWTYQTPRDWPILLAPQLSPSSRWKIVRRIWWPPKDFVGSLQGQCLNMRNDGQNTGKLDKSLKTQCVWTLVLQNLKNNRIYQHLSTLNTYYSTSYCISLFEYGVFVIFQPNI